MSIFIQTLKQMTDDAQVAMNDEAISRCEEYYRLVVKANEIMNLTRITSEADAAQMHFFGAVALLKFIDIPQGARVVDVGTGAGFPGVPLKIVREDLDMTLMDSSGKKMQFVRDATSKIELDASVLTMRAEEAEEQREAFDFVVSRAVAPLPILAELCVPLIKVGGFFCAWKGEKYSQELLDAQTAISELDCSVFATHELGTGAIIIVQKNKPTQDMYPRRFAKIKSDPL